MGLLVEGGKCFALLGGFLGCVVWFRVFFAFLHLLNHLYLDLQTFSLLFFLFSPPSHCGGSERVAVWVFGCCLRSTHPLWLVPARLPPTFRVFTGRLCNVIF